VRAPRSAPECLGAAVHADSSREAGVLLRAYFFNEAKAQFAVGAGLGLTRMNVCMLMALGVGFYPVESSHPVDEWSPKPTCPHCGFEDYRTHEYPVWGDEFLCPSSCGRHSDMAVVECAGVKLFRVTKRPGCCQIMSVWCPECHRGHDVLAGGLNDGHESVVCPWCVERLGGVNE